MSRRVALLFCVASSSAACIAAGVPNGARVTTPADLAGKPEHDFVCESPLSFKLADGKVVEPSAVNPGSSSDTFVYNSPSGLVVVEGKQTITNHWVSGDGDHFFSWYGEDIGTEVIVSTDRQNAVEFLWALQASDGDAYSRQTFPDGTTRPVGVPTHVSSCVTRANYDAIKQAGKRPFFALQAVPVSSVLEGEPNALRVVGCQRQGGKMQGNALANVLPDWGWVPSRVLVVEGANPAAYLDFGRPPWGQLAVWAVPVSAAGDFAAQLGAVRFMGRLWRNDEKLHSEITSEVTATPGTTLRCLYGRTH